MSQPNVWQSVCHETTNSRPGPLLYLGGFDLGMRQARVVQTLHTANALAEQGCSVTLAVGRASDQDLAGIQSHFGVEANPNLRVIGVPTLRLPRLPIVAYTHPRLAAWNWSYGLAVLTAARLLPGARRPRLVLARDPRLAWLALGARRLLGAEVIYEVHELFSTRAREPIPGSASTPTTSTARLRGLEATVFRDCFRLITLTKCCREILKSEFGVQGEKILVAPDAVANVPTELPPRAPASRTLVYAGQLYPWKGVGTLVQALAELPDERLRIVGGLAADDPHAAALRMLARELGVADRIEFTGFLPHTAVRGAITGQAAAVIPLPDNPMSRFFTSPLKLYEYMAAGLPIVASDLPALREVLRHEHNALLVPPDDPVALAGALRRLIHDEGLAERLRATAHADVQGRTWAARAASMLSFVS